MASRFRSSLMAPFAIALAVLAGGAMQISPAATSATAEWRSGKGSPVLGTIVPERSAVRYRVREQLAGLRFPNDAVGETKAISGSIVVTSEGAVAAGQSRVIVDLRNIASDESRRDRYLQRNTLQTNRFPYATFVLREIRGLPWPPPAGTEATFQLVGDLTVRDQTRPTAWDATARFTGEEVTGKASTDFTFAEFGLTKPRVMSVLSVDDTIRLELDFTLSLEPDET